MTDFGLSQAKAAAFVASYDISSTGGMTPRVPGITLNGLASPVSPHLLGSTERTTVKVSRKHKRETKRETKICFYTFAFLDRMPEPNKLYATKRRHQVGTPCQAFLS